MSAFIQQLPALTGVVIGALGSYLAIVRGDRDRTAVRADLALPDGRPAAWQVPPPHVRPDPE